MRGHVQRAEDGGADFAGPPTPSGTCPTKIPSFVLDQKFLVSLRRKGSLRKVDLIRTSTLCLEVATLQSHGHRVPAPTRFPCGIKVRLEAATKTLEKTGPHLLVSPRRVWPGEQFCRPWASQAAAPLSLSWSKCAAPCPSSDSSPGGSGDRVSPF